MAITLIDLLKRLNGSGVDGSKFVKSDGAGRFIMSSAAGGTLSYTALIGDGTTNPWVVTHSLGTMDVIPSVRIDSTGEIIEATFTVTDANHISINFAFEDIPTTNQYKVLVLAGGSVGSVPSLGVPRCMFHNNAAQTLTHNVISYLIGNTEDYDTDTMHDTITNNDRITIRTAGVYLLTAAVEWVSNAAGIRQLRFELNGTTLIHVQDMVPVTANASQMTMAGVANLIIGDYVRLAMYQSSGGNLNVAANANWSSYFSATLLSR